MTLGDIVFARFPFADRPRFKLRPVLVVSEPDAQGDFTALKITSRHLDDPQRIRLAPEDFATGHLSRESAVVLGSVTRLHRDSITQRVASLTTDALKPILKRGILGATRDFSRIAHTANRPGDDPLHPQNAEQLPGDPATTAAHPPPAAPYAARVFTEDEVEAAVSSTLDFWLTLGAEGEALSQELSEFLGVRDSILTNSGSSANLLAVSALTTHKLPPEQRLRPGDEVITCAAGFPTTVNPILQQGLVPVFLDNDPLTGNADLSRLEEAYQPGRTKAVMMAHTLGNPFDLATVCAFCHRHGLWLIEDNCDALGSTYTLPLEQARSIGLEHLVRIAEKGKHPRITVSEAPTTDESPATGSQRLLTAPTGTFGHLSTQSFYPPHHLTMGEGGAVNIVRSKRLKTYVESFRDWGRDCWCASGVDNTCGKRFAWQLGELPEGYDHKYIYSHLGYNLKPLDIQAAIGRQQVKRLPAFIEARRRNWEYLREGLADLEDCFAFNLPTHATAWLPPAERTEPTSTFQWRTHSFPQPHSTHPSWFGFMLLVRPEAPFTKSQFAAHLDSHKIGNRMLFGGNLTRQPVFVQLRKDNPHAFRILGSPASTSQPADLDSPLPGADCLMNQAIFLGVYPGLTTAQLDHVIATIRAFVAERVQLASAN